MTTPDPINAIRLAMLDEESITDLLLPQAALTGLTIEPIFAYEYPRKVANAPATGYGGHDWAALLQAKSILLLLITPSGRVRSAGDESRALWSRPRFDLQAYGPTYSKAAELLRAAEAWLKALSRVRSDMSDGTALIHAVTVEGGPIHFPDPDTESPVVTGIYAASFAEEFVDVAEVAS